jgi:hypothetical protein
MMSAYELLGRRSWLFSSLPDTRGESAASPGWVLKYLRRLQVGGDGALCRVSCH